MLKVLFAATGSFTSSATFAKINLEGNVCSLRTLQDWLGHKNLASTMVYLKYVGGREIHERVNNSELAAFAIPYVK